MKGINIGDSFSPIDSNQRSCTGKSQLDWEIAWNNPRITREYIHALKDYGFEIIKLPVTWKDHIVARENEYIYKPWLDRVKEVINWCIDEGLYVVIDTHHDEEWITGSPDLQSNLEMFKNIWIDICDAFEDINNNLWFESLCEVGFKTISYTSDSRSELIITEENYHTLYLYNETFRDVVRTSNGYNKTRKIIMPGMFSDLKNTMDSEYMKFPEDNNMEISIHIYPYDLTINSGYNYVGRYRDQLKKDTITMIESYLKKMKKDNRYKYTITEFGMISIRPKEDIAWYIRTMYELGDKYDVDMYLWDDGSFMNRYTGECRLIDLKNIMRGV